MLPCHIQERENFFLVVIIAVGIEREEFSLHRLRSGGTSAAANAGVDDRLFKNHGC